MDLLYVFTVNPDYPDPLEEIDALCTLDGNDKPTFLLLANKPHPPLSGASSGEIVGLCTITETNEGKRLILHGTAVVAGECIHGDTPPSVQPIYGDLAERVFCPLKDLKRLPSDKLPDTTLSCAEQEVFLKRPGVKRLTPGTRTSRTSSTSGPSKPDGPPTTFTIPKLVFPQKPLPFVVVGLDPTAGTWESRMSEGPIKEMPSFALRWDGGGFTPDGQPLQSHLTNADFWAEVDRRNAKVICIDGPCATNGPRLLENLSNWDPQGPNGTRSGELALSRQGINLFWTTQNTVMNFDGASRWIARSQVLFSECSNRNKIETHPHGAFTFLWRLFGGTGTLQKKSTPSGRNARVALLRSFIPGLSDEMIPNHDARDAACAALVAGLHVLGLTIPFGTPSDGGEIWMPDVAKLRNLLPCE